MVGHIRTRPDISGPRVGHIRPPRIIHSVECQFLMGSSQDFYILFFSTYVLYSLMLDILS
jgi:hypothetical protein